MTPQEALKIIDKVHDYPCPYGIGGTAWLIIRNCIEKQIPQKPTEQKEVLYVMTGKCPCCGSGVNAMTNDNYCQNKGCGQALDWSDTE